MRQPWVAIVTFVAAAHASGVAGRADTVHKLDGLAYGQRYVTHLGCLESAARYLHVRVSPAWLYGVTGHAFVMCLGEDLCPSGPHSWDQSPLHRLARNLPIRIDGVAGPQATPELLAQARRHVRESIDAGYPCYGWHYEWTLITGYTPDGYVYSGIVDPPTSWQDFGARAIGFLEIYSVRRQDPAPVSRAVREALQFAIAWAATPPAPDRGAYQRGLAAYDAWISGLQSGKADPLGLAYHAAVWSECRGFALEFLREADRRTERKHTRLFAEAVRHYQVVSDSLAEVSRLWPLPAGRTTKEERTAIQARKIDAATLGRMVAALGLARDAEREGVEALEPIAAALAE